MNSRDTCSRESVCEELNSTTLCTHNGFNKLGQRRPYNSLSCASVCRLHAVSVSSFYIHNSWCVWCLNAAYSGCSCMAHSTQLCCTMLQQRHTEKENASNADTRARNKHQPQSMLHAACCWLAVNSRRTRTHIYYACEIRVVE